MAKSNIVKLKEATKLDYREYCCNTSDIEQPYTILNLSSDIFNNE